MGKKKRNIGYDQQALKGFEKFLNAVRMPIKQGGIAELKINLERLEEAIKKLPKKEREHIERYWGLIPGTPIRAKLESTRKNKDQASKNMMEAAIVAVKKLLDIDYLRYYDEQVEEIIQNFIKKIDKTGVEYLSDMEAIKYFLIFLIFIVGGEKMIYEEEDRFLNLNEEKSGQFDNYSLLKVTWFATGKLLDDQSINMELLLHVLEMFDLKDIIAMKRYVGLPIDMRYESIETDSIETFKDVRLFKERLFSKGAWDVTTVLIYSTSFDPIDLSVFKENIPKFRDDWKNFYQFKTGEFTIETSAGEKTVDCYEVGEAIFTDPYEAMTLYVCRRMLK